MIKVLVVDNDKSFLDFMGIYLKEFNVVYDRTNNVTDAFELIRKNNYDIAFIDFYFPIIDGGQLIKAINGSKGRTRLYILTGAEIDYVKESLGDTMRYISGIISKTDITERLDELFVN